MDYSTLLRLKDREVHEIEVEPVQKHFVIPLGNNLVAHADLVHDTVTYEGRDGFGSETKKIWRAWVCLVTDKGLFLERRQVSRMRGIHTFKHDGNTYSVRILSQREDVELLDGLVV